ncbi:MAG: phage portal protein [Rhodobacterales bacterium]|nr:MAG: phage portal protein [Rhodobacterales bacterium]
MSLFSAILGRRDAATVPAAPRAEPPVSAEPMAAAVSGTAQPESWMTEIGFDGGGAGRVKTLPRVTGDTAERHATVFGCCTVIAGDLAKVPLKLWQRDGRGGEARVEEHPADYLLNVECGHGIPAKVLRLGLIYTLALRGNAYAFAPRTGGGELDFIEPVAFQSVDRFRSRRDMVYRFIDGAGDQRTAMARSMIHMRYMALDGWTGRSPIQVASESVGLALAGQRSAARTASGTTAKAVIALRDDYEDDEARTRSAERIKRNLADPDNGMFAVMNAGEDIKTLDLSSADQELLASRRFDREQLAQIYRVPPAKLMMLEFGVKANSEQQNLDWRTDGAMHWSRQAEDMLGMTLLTEAERRRGLFFRHDFDALLQPTMKEFYDALKVAVGGPWITPNRAQQMTKQPITPGGGELYPPANMTRDEKKDPSDESK